jgi:energy-coupling factor transporter ATP-binding protein EcfA2
LNGDLRGDEEDVDSALPDRIDTFLQSATLRRDALKSLLASGASGELPPALPEAPTQALRAKAVAHREEAKKLKATSVAKSLELQLDLKAELEARKTLHVHRSLLADEIQRQGRHVKRRAASKDCSTTSLSNLAKKLTGQFVTGALVQGFNRELSTLGGGHLRVCLEGKGARKGDSFTGLALEDKARRAAASKVFSEGEQRAVALAWFLSELAISPTMSAIVFDDPVTSMDHRWREKVASRLAKEAKHRQVIVFTHDAVFLTMISTACSRIGVDHRGLHVQRQGQRPGYCSDEPPWDTKGVRDRVAALTDRHVRLVKAHKLGTDEEYAEAVATFLDRLRKTWERAIEECLFNGCIRRFGPGIETQRIAKIDLIPSDYQAIEAGMGRCSEWVHDPALALANPPPEPVELARMLNALVEWVQQLRARRPKNSLPNLKPISIQAQP